MKISLRGWILIGACAAVAAWAIFGAPFAQAQSSSEGSSGQLTEESLGRMLQAMGLKPQKVEKRYDFTFKAIHEKEEWALSMTAVLSKDGESIWVMAWLDQLPKSATQVPRTALLRLLADNDRMGDGKFFAYVASNRRFVLQRVIPNKNITTRRFGLTLQDLGQTVADTHPHWNVANWLPKKPSSQQQQPTTRSATSRTKFDAPRRR